MGRVRILLDVEVDLTDRDVLLVEDIVDTGLTLSYLLSILRARASRLARAVHPARPLGPADRAAHPRYVGFDCPDSFVVGYGLDFDERYRNLADILEISDTTALKADPDAALASRCDRLGCALSRAPRTVPARR